MKRIKKTHPPRELLEWLKDNEGLDCSYSALQGKPAHKALKRHLLKEQGYICAYTGIEISEANSHIEHLKPQNSCKQEKGLKKKYLDDVEYHNMVACFPEDGGNVSFGYGAPVKGGWWNESEFVSPCRKNCEKRFIYGWNGEIKFVDGDKAAETTIKILGLGTKRLKDKRSRYIAGFFGFSRKVKDLSQRDAKKLLAVISELPPTGPFKEFCFISEQLLPKYINQP